MDFDIAVGIGTDAHAFDAGRPMHLACLQWPDEPAGLAGHSDADVAAHAVCDAVFSAAGIGDLGAHFGTAEPQWTEASGAVLLAEAGRRVTGAGWVIINAAVQIVGNAPRLGARRVEAEQAMTAALGAPVRVSATSTDGMGFTGRDEGVAAIATALVRRV